MHCSRMLIVQTLVFSRSYLHRQVSPSETLVVKGGTTWGREMADEFCLKMPDFHLTFRDLLHAVNLRHGTNGFTSLPKEGVLKIFSPWKNPTASAWFEPVNLGTKGQHATSRPPKPLYPDDTEFFKLLGHKANRLRSSWSVLESVWSRMRYFFMHEFRISRILFVKGNCVLSPSADLLLRLRSVMCVTVLRWKSRQETSTDYGRQT